MPRFIISTLFGNPVNFRGKPEDICGDFYEHSTMIMYYNKIDARHVTHFGVVPFFTDPYVKFTRSVDEFKDMVDDGELCFSNCKIMTQLGTNPAKWKILDKFVELINEYMRKNEYGLSVILDSLEDNNVFNSQIKIGNAGHHNKVSCDIKVIEFPIPSPKAAMDIISICRRGI